MDYQEVFGPFSERFRIVFGPFSDRFGRTDLRRGVSGAKFDAESDFEVRFAVAPQKPHKNRKKQNFRSANFAFFFPERPLGQGSSLVYLKGFGDWSCFLIGSAGSFYIGILILRGPGD